MELKKTPFLEKRWNNNWWPTKCFSMLIFLILILAPLWAGVATSQWMYSGGWSTPNFSISADSLITTATVTLIVFTNFAPNNSSGSSSIIRRIYWRSPFLSTDSSAFHGFMWFFFNAWITPAKIIFITLMTTVTEVIVISSTAPIWIAYSMFAITCYLLMTALVRFFVFHIYSNKNVAYWLFSKLSSDKFIKEFYKTKSPTFDLLSFFRQTGNYELLFVITKKLSENAKYILPSGKRLFNIRFKPNTNGKDDLLHHTFTKGKCPKTQEGLNEIRARLLSLFYFNILINENLTKNNSFKTSKINEHFRKVLSKSAMDSIYEFSIPERVLFASYKEVEPEKADI